MATVVMPSQESQSFSQASVGGGGVEPEPRRPPGGGEEAVRKWEFDEEHLDRCKDLMAPVRSALASFRPLARSQVTNDEKIRSVSDALTTIGRLITEVTEKKPNETEGSKEESNRRKLRTMLWAYVSLFTKESGEVLANLHRRLVSLAAHERTKAESKRKSRGNVVTTTGDQVETVDTKKRRMDSAGPKRRQGNFEWTVRDMQRPASIPEPPAPLTMREGAAIVLGHYKVCRHSIASAFLLLANTHTHTHAPTGAHERQGHCRPRDGLGPRAHDGPDAREHDGRQHQCRHQQAPAKVQVLQACAGHVPPAPVQGHVGHVVTTNSRSSNRPTRHVTTCRRRATLLAPCRPRSRSRSG